MKKIKQFVKLAGGKSVAYNDGAKQQFHYMAHDVLYSLAQSLGYKPEQFEIRHNLAGIAVSGEAILHSDVLYVQLSQSALGPSYGFMWRRVRGRRDYTGGPNQWAKWEELLNIPALADKMKRHVEL